MPGQSEARLQKKSAKKDLHHIERAAVVLTVNRVLKDEEIDRIADGILTLQASEDTTIPALKKQLADTERGIENMLNAIQQGVLTSSTKERLEALEKQRDNLKIAVLQAELQKPKYTKEQIVRWIGQFKCGDVNSREYQKRIIDTFVNSCACLMTGLSSPTTSKAARKQSHSRMSRPSMVRI